MSVPLWYIAVTLGLVAFVWNGWSWSRVLPDTRGTETLLDVYDYIIVGAASAGSILVYRLSEDSETTVLLIEAGGHYLEDPIIQIPAAHRETLNTDTDWQFYTKPQNHACLGLNDRRSFWPRGKVLGGSSAINAMEYARGLASDYDEREIDGCTGWGHKDVLPYFLKSEDILIDSLS